MKFKTFTAEALLAADVNNLLMRQVVIQVDNNTERDSIPVPTEGMVCYVDSSARHEYFDGTDWVPLLPTTTGRHCVVRKSAAQNLTTTPTALSFDVEVSDPDNMHNNATNNTRVTFDVAGTYLIACQVYNSNSSGVGVMFARLNGTTAIVGSRARRTADAGAGCELKATVSVVAAVNDYVEILVSHATGTGTIQGGAAEDGAVLTVTRL